MTREKVGKVKEYDRENSAVKIHLTEEVSTGDKLAFLGPVAYQSQKAEKIIKQGEEVEEAEEGEVTIPTDTEAREDTSVYKIV